MANQDDLRPNAYDQGYYQPNLHDVIQAVTLNEYAYICKCGMSFDTPEDRDLHKLECDKFFKEAANG